MLQTITKDGWRRALPISQSVIRTSISAAAYRAIAVSSMRLLLELQRGPQGGCFLCLDQATVNELMAAKRRSEDFSDLIIRMAKAASGRLSLVSGRLSPQAYAISRHSPT
jgi:hypothetical protein